MKHKAQMKCHACGKQILVDVFGDGDGIWTVFCTPEELWQWQKPRTEQQIIDETSGPGMPYNRCQWCRCTLKSGYHETGCPVRALTESELPNPKDRAATISYLGQTLNISDNDAAVAYDLFLKLKNVWDTTPE